VIRSLWETRDELARTRDIAPGRVLPDSAIVEAAQQAPEDEPALLALPVFRGRAQRRLASTWLGAIRQALRLTKAELPATSPAADGPPPTGRWADRDPDAAARLAAARAALATIAAAHHLPADNLLLPDLLRRTCWQPPADLAEPAVAAALAAGGARRWQLTLTSAALAVALRATAPTTTDVTDDTPPAQ
jgi:ribonuclease D